MNKYHGKYYLQYGAPGTEFSGYADGVYVGSGPLGPFVYQEHNPFSYKPGGFVRGAGHGATFRDTFGRWWHVSTVVVGVKNNFERRIGIWPAAFDEDDILYANTSYGDYPHYLPGSGIDRSQSLFTGWMLLNYCKPVQVSSTLGGVYANNAVDEDIKTYWSAETGEAGEWFQTDLGKPCEIRAVQVNYADQDADFLGKPTDFYHQYRILGSVDGNSWFTVIDKSNNRKDVPHDYIQLDSTIIARYLKLVNVHVPTGKFALSGFRVFGTREGRSPGRVEEFEVLRGPNTHRNAWMKWKASADATGYVIYTGIHPGKLYNSIMVYGKNEHYFPAMDQGKTYYFQIEAFNESGISKRSGIIKAE